MTLATVSASFPNSAVALDEQITAKVIQLVGTVRPDLEVLLWVASTQRARMKNWIGWVR